jgi:hypothetical protein
MNCVFCDTPASETRYGEQGEILELCEDHAEIVDEVEECPPVDLMLGLRRD